MDGLLRRGLRRLRTDGFEGFVRASQDYASNWRRRRIDTSLDRKYGTETAAIISASEHPEGVSAHAENWTGYQAIQIPVFHAIMHALPIDPANYTFLDYGSGKGRALLLAALYGYRRIIGVEFVPALHAIAQRNVARFAQSRRLAAAIELHCQDATDYALPDDDLVCFLYNPFDMAVLKQVLANIVASAIARPRPLWVIYRNPVHARLLDETPHLMSYADTGAFRIYRAYA